MTIEPWSLTLGAAIAVVAVSASSLTTAIADRIRGSLKNGRHLPSERVREPRTCKAAPAASPPRTKADAALESDAISGLVNLGYPRKDAAASVAACQGSQRSTLDALIRASLHRLNHPDDAHDVAS